MSSCGAVTAYVNEACNFQGLYMNLTAIVNETQSLCRNNGVNPNRRRLRAGPGFITVGESFKSLVAG